MAKKYEAIDELLQNPFTAQTQLSIVCDNEGILHCSIFSDQEVFVQFDATDVDEAMRIFNQRSEAVLR